MLFILLWMSTAQGYASNKYRELELAGDIFQIAIPITAFTTTLGLKDWQGSKQFLKGFIAAELTSYGLKYSINERRPRHGYQSFPSGHTTIAFFGSAFIHHRYGLRYAIPAYAAACLVGYSRVKVKAHWVHDVLGGAAIGFLASYFFTTPYQYKDYRFTAAITPNSVGVWCEREF